ncbi:TlpA disulfide reductase family protein [Runella sp.]|jgi:thiol-disulfide isomerase/thioredoxin|uniref:TlpA family protein disulfide reductase n=1 Tax=Runella sp. TaxID=1960881 RepID=UPI00301A9F1D
MNIIPKFLKISLLIWVLSAPCLRAFAQNVVISGEIKNPVDSSVSFILLRNGLVGERELIDIQLDKLNRFSLKLVLDDIAYIHFLHGTTSGIVFRNWIVEKQDSVILYFDAKNFLETLSFKGTNAMKYNYYAEDAKKWQSWTGEYMKRLKQPIEEQYRFIDSVEVGKLKLLQSYSKHLSPLFCKVRYADIKGDVNESRFSSLMSGNKDTYSLRTLPNELKKFLYTMPSQNDTTAKSLFFVAYLDALSTFLYRDLKELFGVNGSSNLMDFQRSIYSPKVAENQFAYQIFDKFRTEGVNEKNKKLYDEYVKDYPNSPYIPFLNGRQIKSTAVNRGQKAFDLGNDPVFKLENYSGKVVVLDFWASWCSSCIADAKYIRKIKEELKENGDVVFLSISLDESEADWKKAIAKWEIPGTHTRLKNGFKDPISKMYGIMGLPSYFIIDKQGNFADINPPRPRYNDGHDLLNAIKQIVRN